jgi:hypothetical protein
LRLEELAALDADDLAISARKGREVVRSGKRDAYREMALNAGAREGSTGGSRRGGRGSTVATRRFSSGARAIG